MATEFKINNLFNRSDFDFLWRQGIRHFSFDFRPREMSFIPLDEVLAIIGTIPQEQSVYLYLHFEDDPDFVIKQLVQEILQSYPHIRGALLLEITDRRDHVFWDQFGIPYIRRLEEQTYDFCLSPLCRGAILDHLSDHAIQNLATLKEAKRTMSFDLYLETQQRLNFELNCYYCLNLVSYEESFHQIDRQLLSQDLDYFRQTL